MQIFLSILFVLLQTAGVAMQAFMLPGYILQFVLVFTWFIFFDEFNLLSVVILFLATIFVSLIDNVANILGAKKFGASKWGILGAFLGGLLSLFSGQLWGILIFPFLLSFLFEMYFSKKDVKASLKSGFGTFIGYITGYLLKLAISISIFVWSLIALF